MQKLDAYFKEAIKQEASDLHLIGGELPMIRIEGELKEIDDKPLDNKELLGEIFGLLSKAICVNYINVYYKRNILFPSL